MSSCQLGFGSASILGRVGRRASLKALGAAYDAGIRHFDTARSYGWGEAEGLLGEFLKSRPRDEYTLLTKCGIVPRPPSRLKSIAKSAARQVFERVPATRSMVRKVAGSSMKLSLTSDVAALSRSLEESLRELDTDHVDTLLLHNFVPDDPNLNEVVAFFQRAKTEGKILGYGFSMEGDLTEGLARLEAEWRDGDFVVQTQISPTLMALPADARQGIRLQANAPIRFLTEQGVPLADASILFAALSRRLDCEVVICSMMTPSHTRINVAAMAAAKNIEENAVEGMLAGHSTTLAKT